MVVEGLCLQQVLCRGRLTAGCTNRLLCEQLARARPEDTTPNSTHAALLRHCTNTCTSFNHSTELIQTNKHRLTDSRFILFQHYSCFVATLHTRHVCALTDATTRNQAKRPAGSAICARRHPRTGPFKETLALHWLVLAVAPPVYPGLVPAAEFPRLARPRSSRLWRVCRCPTLESSTRAGTALHTALHFSSPNRTAVAITPLALMHKQSWYW